MSVRMAPRPPCGQPAFSPCDPFPITALCCRSGGTPRVAPENLPPRTLNSESHLPAVDPDHAAVPPLTLFVSFEPLRVWRGAQPPAQSAALSPSLTQCTRGPSPATAGINPLPTRSVASPKPKPDRLSPIGILPSFLRCAALVFFFLRVSFGSLPTFSVCLNVCLFGRDTHAHPSPPSTAGPVPVHASPLTPSNPSAGTRRPAPPLGPPSRCSAARIRTKSTPTPSVASPDPIPIFTLPLTTLPR